MKLTVFSSFRARETLQGSDERDNLPFREAGLLGAAG